MSGDPRRQRGRPRGPRPAADVVGGFAASLQPLTMLAEVQRVWPAAVGDAIAEQAQPTAEGGGVVTVTCVSAVWAQELDLMAGELLERLNAALGSGSIRALRCQAAPARSWARRTE